MTITISLGDEVSMTLPNRIEYDSFKSAEIGHLNVLIIKMDLQICKGLDVWVYLIGHKKAHCSVVGG